jgi:hypothetical protein
MASKLPEKGTEWTRDPKYDDYEFPTIAPTPQNGHAGYTTPEQDAQVHQLRSLLEQTGYTKNLDTLTMVGSSALATTHGHAPLTFCAAAISPRTEVRCSALQENVRSLQNGKPEPGN